MEYLAGDAYYSKGKFVNLVVAAGLHIVSKLRVNADLWWLYAGDYQGQGRPRKYDGKVVFEEDLARFDLVDKLDNGMQVYSGIVYSNCLKRKIRLVMLRWVKGNKVGRALLFSTDTALAPHQIIRFYKARLQIECVFRDAKQYTELTHCQYCRKEAIHAHTNASLVVLNLLKLEDQAIKASEGESVISIASWKRRKFNQHFMERLFKDLGLNIKSKKVRDVYQWYSDYGSIAA